MYHRTMREIAPQWRRLYSFAGTHITGGQAVIKQVKFVSVPVADQKRALEFYTRKLGFSIVTDQEFDGKQRWIELGIPGAQTGVVLFTPDEHKDRVGTFSAVSFHCDSCEKTYEEL